MFPSHYRLLWAFHKAKHDNSGPAIELTLVLCKLLCQRVAEGSRVGIMTSKRGDHSERGGKAVNNFNYHISFR